MKLKKSMWMMFFFFGFLMVLISAIGLKADDVYNFYFQKAPGPSTVIQGGQPPANVPQSPSATVIQGAGNTTVTTPAATPPDAQVAAKTEAKKAEDADTLKKWEIFFGIGGVNFTTTYATTYQMSDGSFAYTANQELKQITIGGQYNFNKYLAVEVNLMQIEGRPLKFSGNTNFDVSGGLVVTPFHIDVFGSDIIDVGFVGGATTVPLCGDYTNVNEECTHTSSWFYGTRLDINFSRTVAFTAVGENLVDTHSNQFLAMMGIKL